MEASFRFAHRIDIMISWLLWSLCRNDAVRLAARRVHADVLAINAVLASAAHDKHNNADQKQQANHAADRPGDQRHVAAVGS